MFNNAMLEALHQAASGQDMLPLQPITFQHGAVLAECGAPIDDIVFPETGLISLVVRLGTGDKVEAGMVGHDGLIGAAAAFGAHAHICSAFVQIQGHGWLMRAADFRRIARQGPNMDALLMSHEQYVLAQAQQMSACSARHHLAPRMSTWLLRASDVVGGNELEVTQEHLAEMLGVQRASVSVLAAQMQEENLIHYRRGRVTITDRHHLHQNACECYDSLAVKKRTLFGALPRPLIIGDAERHGARHEDAHTERAPAASH